jgi:integrase
MGRPRKVRAGFGLLDRMQAMPWADGKTITYRYHPVGAKPINLGTDKRAAIIKVLELTGQRESMGTLNWVWEKYQESKKWTGLAKNTRTDYEGAWKQIKERMGDMHISTIDAPTVARYVHIERASTPRRANIEKALLSNLFKHGILLGVCQHNPAPDVEPHPSEARTEAPEAELLKKFLEWVEKQTPQRAVVGMMAEFASLVGARRTEFLDLTWFQINEDEGVIRLKRAKQRGKKEVIDVIGISPAIADLLERLRALQAQRKSQYVFPTEDDSKYSDRGFKSMWQRIKVAAELEGVLPTRKAFTFHDLRAYYATMHKQKTGVLPDLHKNPETTSRIYDRNKFVRREGL